MIIVSGKERKIDISENVVKKGDIIDIVKFNSLPSPVTARLLGGGEWWIETLCVQTGAMRLDVCGLIDHHSFDDVIELIDIDGGKHKPDDFYIDA